MSASIEIGYFSNEEKTKRVARLIRENSGYRRYLAEVSNMAGNVSILVSSDRDDEDEETLSESVLWIMGNIIGKLTEA